MRDRTLYLLGEAEALGYKLEDIATELANIAAEDEDEQAEEWGEQVQEAAQSLIDLNYDTGDVCK